MGSILTFCKKETEKLGELKNLNQAISVVLKEELDKIFSEIEQGKSSKEISADILNDISKKIIDKIIKELNDGCDDLCSKCNPDK